MVCQPRQHSPASRPANQPVWLVCSPYLVAHCFFGSAGSLLGSTASPLVQRPGGSQIGNCYYDKIGIEPPNKFDFNQDAVRKGRSLYISMLDGTTRKVSTWNNIKNEFVMTKLGRQFYANAVDKYTVLFPCWVALTRVNGSIYRRKDWMPSSAIENLGEIEVPKNLNGSEQRSQVADIVKGWVEKQPMVFGERILLPGYETYSLDPERDIQYNKLSVNAGGSVDVVMHRPLREGIP